MEKDNKKKEIEVEVEAPEAKKEIFKDVSHETNQKLDKMSDDLKQIVDKLDSFEVDVDDILSAKDSLESNDKNKSLLVLLIVLAFLIAWAFKGKLIEAIEEVKQKQSA